MSDMTPQPAPGSPELNLTEEQREVLRSVSGLWWVPIVRGVLFIAIGGYALLLPGVSLAAFTQVLGIFIVLDGVLAIIAAVAGWVESRWWVLLRGVLAILAGLFVAAHPLFFGAVGVTTLVILLAVQSIVCGVLEIVTAIRERKEIEGEWWLILGGLLGIVFGGILLANPLLGGRVLVQVLGVCAMLTGVLLIVSGFRLKKFKPQEA